MAGAAAKSGCLVRVAWHRAEPYDGLTPSAKQVRPKGPGQRLDARSNRRAGPLTQPPIRYLLPHQWRPPATNGGNNQMDGELMNQRSRRYLASAVRIAALAVPGSAFASAEQPEKPAQAQQTSSGAVSAQDARVDKSLNTMARLFAKAVTDKGVRQQIRQQRANRLPHRCAHGRRQAGGEHPAVPGRRTRAVRQLERRQLHAAGRLRTGGR